MTVTVRWIRQTLRLIAFVFAGVFFCSAHSTGGAQVQPPSSPDAMEKVTLPSTQGAWRVRVSVTGGFVGGVTSYVANSNGEAANSKGAVSLPAEKFALLAAAIESAHDNAWTRPNSSFCCDQRITTITLTRRLVTEREATHSTAWGQAPAAAPSDARAIVAAVLQIFPPATFPS